MADSNIVVSGLTATGGVGQIVLAWTAADASEFRSLPYMQLDRFEIWSATANNRANATKVGETIGNQFVHSGLLINTTRFYWVRARDRSGNLGDYLPLSATAGISATTSTTAPPPNSVGETELQNNAVSAAKIQAGAITAVKIAADAITADKIAANAVTADAIAAGTITAAKIASKAITADKINVTRLDAIAVTLGDVLINGNVILGGTINGGKLEDFAVSTQKIGIRQVTNSDGATSTGDRSVGTSWTTLVSLNISASEGQLTVTGNAHARSAGSGVSYGGISLFRDGVEVTGAAINTDDEPSSFFGISFVDTNPSNSTWELKGRASSGIIVFSQRFIGYINGKR
jgi:hypothetical protein